MNGPAWNHRHVWSANGIGIHYVRHGNGYPLVLLHGWPEFWYTWRKNIPVLAGEFDVVAPDLRGFGDTDKPGLPDPPKSFWATSWRICAPSRTLWASRGSGWSATTSAPTWRRGSPGSIRNVSAGLFFFDCPYPGIGRRWADAG